MATFKSVEVYASACDRLRAAVKTAESNPACSIHIGKSNSKTGASINEGTTPIVTCCAHACKTCGKSCYAIIHVDNIYPAARKNHAENTVMRRRNATEYYTAFFETAFRRGSMLRVNETGDFENAKQIRALAAVARLFPTVKVVGYTRRVNLVAEVATLIKACPNVSIRYSCFTDAPSAYDEEARNMVKVCRVDHEKSTCLAQLYAAKGEIWTCAACAAKGCGCFGRAKCVTFKMH